MLIAEFNQLQLRNKIEAMPGTTSACIGEHCITSPSTVTISFELAGNNRNALTGINCTYGISVCDPSSNANRKRMI
ncbi:hypothetical protein BLOT_006533 [Blomia tropicalis]|nr:hypothetical protein BLOT_006533 [Blomia tropicalis]